MPSLSNIKTPGVYVQEVSKFPPSVAAVETAIPAFIGYTEIAVRKDEKLWNKPFRISSLLEFESHFGGSLEEGFKFDVDFDPLTNSINSIVTTDSPKLKHNLHYAMQMFFANGGGPCYIVSVGSLNDEIDFDQLKNGVDLLKKVDEVTLIVIPEAIHLSESKFTGLMNHVLVQCTDLQDRFAIMDVQRGQGPDIRDGQDGINNFRTNIASDIENVKYGAAYFPYLETILNYNTSDEKIEIREYKENGKNLEDKTQSLKELVEIGQEANASDKDKKAGEEAQKELEAIKEEELIAIKAEVITAKEELGKDSKIVEDFQLAVQAILDGDDPTSQAVKDAVDATAGAGDELNSIKDAAQKALDENPVVDPADPTAPTEEELKQRKMAAEKVASDVYKAAVKEQAKQVAQAKKALNEKFQSQLDTGSFNDYSGITSQFLFSKNSLLYNAIKQKIQEDHPVVLPSGSTMAGVYARVDSSRGVWKAPANVSVLYVKKPTIKISDEEQENMNVDPTSGKSINAIRTFTGRGTYVWGARTLAGNDNEWRYVSVRRFFNMVEESVKKATYRFVFEPNDKNTWVKVRAMIENFLILQWRAGALAGPTPESAFFVKVGLNETMTNDDILRGFMIVEIGMAVVRPAEFIVLRFSHKMQEA